MPRGTLIARDEGFPKSARLLKTDEFSSVFRLRPWARSAHFVLYARQTDGPARLGLVTGRKFAPRAATRNLIRRIARETFRVRRAELEGWDMLLRLHSRFDRKAMPSASSPPLRAMCREEIVSLIDNAIRTIRRRSSPSTASAAGMASDGRPGEPGHDGTRR
ncbi:ribonuclease P protein component [Pararobbsia silviterrae]|uniref:Ribonuclease P protein component n=1 Tax=Pararobbsia silviterrae TaxID=1792498 RepID=A0A494X7V4_9BURK|nr:ribonuclease P protein component [Pararobbsia silviterrae]RKP44079.1 ribonuclease P protein component [Pararobbsia silviterrae]